MGFLTSLFGGGEDGMSWWGVGFALVIVLVLIIAGLWLLKMLFKATGSVTRGRQRRLAIIDTLNVDAKRSLLLIRRDDVEHLLVIGGAQDVVVETGISTSTHETDRSTPQKPSSKRRPPELVDPSFEPERRRTAAASRLGLTGLLRRYNDPEPDMEPEVEVPEISPLERLKNLGQPSVGRVAPSLRHTGLLRPASNDDNDEETDDDDQSTVEEPQIPATASADSAMNGADQSDDEDISSIEEEAAPDDADSDDADEFAAQPNESIVETVEFAPEVSSADRTKKSRATKSTKPAEFESELDEDATEPSSPRTQH